MSRATVGLVRYEWFARRAAGAAAETATGASREAAQEMATMSRAFDVATDGVAAEATVEPAAGGRGRQTSAAARTLMLPFAAVPAASVATAATTTPDGEDDRRIAAVPVTSSGLVQHVGAWLMLAMLDSMGLYRLAETHRPPRVAAAPLRIALDAFAIAITIGQRCVEAVRRLATPSGPQLLRANHAPSASWVRTMLGSFAAKQEGTRFHFAMAQSYIENAAEDDRRTRAPVVFYVDNHLRPYMARRTFGRLRSASGRRGLRPGIDARTYVR